MFADPHDAASDPVDAGTIRRADCFCGVWSPWKSEPEEIHDADWCVARFTEVPGSSRKRPVNLKRLIAGPSLARDDQPLRSFILEDLALILILLSLLGFASSYAMESRPPVAHDRIDGRVIPNHRGGVQCFECRREQRTSTPRVRRAFVEMQRAPALDACAGAVQ